MGEDKIKKYASHGDGKFEISDFRKIGENVVFEAGVLIFHPDTITLGSNIYIGHNTILKGYYNSVMEIGTNTWIGQGCFFHSAGNIFIGETVGIGPMVRILTSYHKETMADLPIMQFPVDFKAVRIEDGADIGIGAIILPGVTIGRNSIIGAGSVVTKDVKPNSVVAGVPAKLIRMREIKL
jgi:acetyltransferase-like isoleucine patch superfamily enzyme